MAGIYIHIPFCRKNCYYCDFYFSVSLAQKESFVDSLKQEILLRVPEGKGEQFETIYFGGGTPSTLTIYQVKSIIELLVGHYNFNGKPEVTFEANPEDLTHQYVDELLDSGIDRLSIGIQSFEDDDLKLMNRSHASEKAFQAIENAGRAGFRNINIDLIYGLPDMSSEQWLQNLNTALALPVQHISAYHLTIEPKTIFGHWHKKGRIKAPDEGLSNTMFENLMKLTSKKGFIHYEISNFGKPGFFSKHNLIYWQGKSYLGFGPSAHSFNQKERKWNIASIKKYADKISNNQEWWEKEVLDAMTRYNEKIMTGLRTQWGCNLDDIEQNQGRDLRLYAEKEAKTFLESGHLIRTNSHLLLTEKGKFIADYIIAQLMYA